MKISLQWLNEYVDLSEYFEAPEKLDQLLTKAGLEVEHFEDRSRQYQHVVVGQVSQLDQHPNADRLTLCQVDVGEGSTRPIVCGAKNHKAGDKVVVALPGAVLPGDFVIKKSKIRGEESQGMMCSEVELGIAEESQGILILPAEAPVGQSFAEYMGWIDIVFDLNVTPNRADCLSHFGLARELACLLDRSVTAPETTVKGSSSSTESLIEVTVNAKNLCPRYAGRAVRNVKVGPSPAWLQQRLESLGLNSINNVVDITNYVMLELGQPLHAFDAKNLSGGKIIVDSAQKGESFQTLDGTELKLSGQELMIRDGSRPVALAGVVGGLNSGVTESTQDLFIESAHFLPETVRKTARSLGIETDSAYRFSRGTDVGMVPMALNRACQLMEEWAGGESAKDFLDIYPHPLRPAAIAIGQAELEERLGYSVDMKEFDDWMIRLGCQIQVQSSGDRLVEGPLFRWDLRQSVDLVEEFARLHGYEVIPETLPPLHHEPMPHDSEYVFSQHLGHLLGEEGFYQALNYTFLGEKFSSEVLGAPKPNYHSVGVNLYLPQVKILNPLSEDLNVMRTSLIPGLLKNLLYNYRHGNTLGRLFEVGRVFGRKGDHEESSFQELGRLGLLLWGQSESLWLKAKERPVVYDLKEAVETLLQRLGILSWQWRKMDEGERPDFLHPGQSQALFSEGRVIGFIGTLHPAWRERWKLREDAAVAEFSFDDLMRGQPRRPKFKPFSKFPQVERDFAFVVPDDLQAGEIVRQIRKVGGSSLQSVEIFDVYAGQGVPKNHRSVGFRVVYQEKEGTLDEEKLTQIQQNLIHSVSRHFSIEVR